MTERLATLMPPANKQRLDPLDNIVPPLRVGGVESLSLPFLEMRFLTEVSVLVKGVERLIISTVSNTRTMS